MTPDLDQTMSMKAQIQDKVSPQLQKIERFARTTGETVRGMVHAFVSGGDQIGSATQKAADQVQDSTSKMNQGLNEVSQTFQSTSESATQSSSKIGRAVEDALYTRGASSRMDDLEKDLKNLDRTFKSMASTQKTVSGSARSIQAMAHDSLNKKVIPAFQDLNATLNEFPDTLEDLNTKEKERLKYLKEGEGILGKVKDRVSGIGEALNTIQLGLQDAVAVGTAGVVGSVGMEVQDQQRGAARTAGVDYFKTLPRTLEEVTAAAETTMQNVQPITEAIMELRSAPREVMGPLVKELYNVEKATGLSAAGVAKLYDEMARLGGIKGEDMTILVDKVKYFSEESVADVNEMFGVLQQAGDQITMFSGEARKAFAESSLAAAASAANMGLGANAPIDTMNRLLDDPVAFNKVQGLINSAGIDADLQQLYKEGNIDQAQDAIVKAMQTHYGSVDFTDIGQRLGVKGMIGDVFDTATIQKMVEGANMTGEGTGGTATEMSAAGDKEAKGLIARTSELIRGTFSEEAEKMAGASQRGFIESGRKTVEAFADATEFATGVVDSLANTFMKFDKQLGGMLSSGVAGGTVMMAGRTMLRGVGAGLQQTGLPGMGAIGGAIGGQGITGTLLHGALGILGAGAMFTSQGDKTKEAEAIAQAGNARTAASGAATTSPNIIQSEVGTPAESTSSSLVPADPGLDLVEFNGQIVRRDELIEQIRNATAEMEKALEKQFGKGGVISNVAARQAKKMTGQALISVENLPSVESAEYTPMEDLKASLELPTKESFKELSDRYRSDDARSPIGKFIDATNPLNMTKDFLTSPIAKATNPLNMMKGLFESPLAKATNPLNLFKKASQTAHVGALGSLAMDLNPWDMARKVGEGPAGDAVTSTGKWVNPTTLSAKAGEWAFDKPETVKESIPGGRTVISSTFTPPSPEAAPFRDEMLTGVPEEFKAELLKEINKHQESNKPSTEAKTDPNIEKQTELQKEMTQHLKVISEGFKGLKEKEATPQRPGTSPTVERGDNFLALSEGRR